MSTNSEESQVVSGIQNQKLSSLLDDKQNATLLKLLGSKCIVSIFIYLKIDYSVILHKKETKM